MTQAVIAIIIIFGALFAVGLGWRVASRRRQLPCPAWLAWLVEFDPPLLKINSARAIVEHMGAAPGMKALDFGCGPGRVTIPLARAVGPGGSVVAADLQPKMLARAEARARAAGLANVRFVHAAAGEGKLGRGEFDRAALVTVLGEIPNREAAMKELYEALKPGGVLSITEIMLDPHYQSRAAILRLAEAAGFREQAFFGGRFAFTINLERPA